MRWRWVEVVTREKGYEMGMCLLDYAWWIKMWRTRRDTRWNEGAHGLGCRYKEWGNIMGFFRDNNCIWFLSFVIFSIVRWNDSLSFVDINMIGQTMLKPHIPLCELFYLCIFKLALFALKLLLTWHFEQWIYSEGALVHHFLMLLVLAFLSLILHFLSRFVFAFFGWVV